MAKHRNGATKLITLGFQPEFTRFSDFYDASQLGGYAQDINPGPAPAPNQAPDNDFYGVPEHI